MARKRHQKKTRIYLSNLQSDYLKEFSETDKKLLEGITQGKFYDCVHEITDLLNESSFLADEPEFVDLYFPFDEAVFITQRFDERYAQRLLDSENDQEQYEDILDEVFEKIIEKLANHDFRKKLNFGMDAHIRRLSEDGFSHELFRALLIEEFMKHKAFPLSVFGLIRDIYFRSVEFYPEDVINEELASIVEESLRDEAGCEIDLFDIIQDIEGVNEIAKKHAADTGFMKSVENFSQKSSIPLHHDLIEGDIQVELFTSEEVFGLIQQIEGDCDDEEEVVDVEAEAKQSTEIIKQMLRETMTEKRTERLREDMKMMANQWLRLEDRRKYAIPLAIESFNLDVYPPAENLFLYAVLINQVEQTPE